MAKIVIEFGLDSMDPNAKNHLIAPKISELNSPKVPDISAHRKFPLNVFIFNFELSMMISNKRRQLVFNIIRKIQDSFDEYCSATESLKKYIESDKKTVTPYFTAVRHFEHCLAHIYQAVCCMNALSKAWTDQKQFNRGDGSILERVYLINADIKHMDERFEAAQSGEELSFKSFSNSLKNINEENEKIENVPMWLTNEGLETANVKVSYEELSQEILELGKEASKLAHIRPNDKMIHILPNKQQDTKKDSEIDIPSEQVITIKVKGTD